MMAKYKIVCVYIRCMLMCVGNTYCTFLFTAYRQPLEKTTKIINIIFIHDIITVEKLKNMYLPTLYIIV